MKFFFTFRKSASAPNENHYVSVDAPCEVTAIERLHAKNITNWSTIYRHERYVLRQKLTLWREI